MSGDRPGSGSKGKSGSDAQGQKSEAGFWNGLKSIGAGILEGLVARSPIDNASPKPSVSRRDPVASNERPVAARQVHRSMKAWRDREDDSDAEKQDEQSPATDELADEAPEQETTSVSAKLKRMVHRSPKDGVIHRAPGDKPPLEELRSLLHAEALAAVSGLGEEQLKTVLTHMKGPRKQDVNDLLRIFTIKKNKGKDVPEGDVMTYLAARLAGAAETQARKFPFGFENAENFAKFSERVKAAVGHWGIPTGDIRVQGSSVSRPEPKDIDVAVMVDAPTFTGLVNRFKTNTGKDRVKSMIDDDARKGKITSFCMDRMEVPKDSGLGQPLEGARSIQIQLVHAIDDGNADAKGTEAKVQISVVKLGGDFDLGPFIPV